MIKEEFHAGMEGAFSHYLFKGIVGLISFCLAKNSEGRGGERKALEVGS